MKKSLSRNEIWPDGPWGRWPVRRLHFRFQGGKKTRIRGGDGAKKGNVWPTGNAMEKRREKGNDDEVDYDRYLC